MADKKQASGALGTLYFSPETVNGTTNANPKFKQLPVKNFTINASKDTFEDTTLNPDAMMGDPGYGNVKASCEFETNLMATHLDPLFEALLSSNFVAIAPVPAVPTTPDKPGTPAVPGYSRLDMAGTSKSFTFNYKQGDLELYQDGTGFMIDKCEIHVPTSGFATTKWTTMGRKWDILSKTDIAGATYDTYVPKTGFTHAGGTFCEGSNVVGYMTDIKFSIDNGYSANYGLGSENAYGLSYQMRKITGTVGCFFEDASLINKFYQEVCTSLNFKLVQGTDTLQFNLPRIWLTGAPISVTGNGPMVIQLPFTAVFDTASATNIRFIKP